MRVAIVAALLVACSSAPAPAPASNALPAEVWDVADYTKAGVPALDATWTAEQHEAAAAALETAIAGSTNHGRLPHLGGARSGAVFARIIEMPQGDDVLADPVKAIGAHIRRFEASERISKLYLIKGAAAPSAEWVAIFGTQLAEAELLDPGSTQLLATTPATDPKYTKRVEGFAQMRQGWGQMLHAGTRLLADVRIPEAVRVGFAKDLKHPLQTLFPKLEPGAQTLIKQQLEKLHEQMRTGALHDALPPVP